MGHYKFIEQQGSQRHWSGGHHEFADHRAAVMHASLLATARAITIEVWCGDELVHVATPIGQPI